MIQFVLCYGHSEYTRVCIDSIYKNTPKEHINLVVWQNKSEDEITEQDINSENTVLLNFDQNYGVSLPVNSMFKDFGLGLNQDLFYISNDHYFFKNWIDPWLENKDDLDLGNPLCPNALHCTHDGLINLFPTNFKENISSIEKRKKFLDYPESEEKILQYIKLMYPFENEIEQYTSELPRSTYYNDFWMGCFYVNKKILKDIPTQDTSQGLAAGEDTEWLRKCERTGSYKMSTYNRSYVHHFKSITTSRYDLTNDVGEFFVKNSIPEKTDYCNNLIQEGIEKIKGIINNK